MKKFTYLKEIDGFRYYVYKPSLLYPYYNGYKDDRHYSLKHKIRMILEQLSGNGYRVYYLETSEQKVGYCVVRYGGGKNLKWSGKNDLILGPLRVKQMYQGNGFATKLVHSILFNLESFFQNSKWLNENTPVRT